MYKIRMLWYFLFFVPLLSVTSETFENSEVKECSENACRIENSCRCSSSESPLPKQTIPQLVSLTFNENVDDSVYNQLFGPMLFERKNPDKTPISATFFVPHEFTDYERVHDLYIKGFEIGVYSISKTQDARYWEKATAELITKEFSGQKQIISKFANVPADDIIGARMPYFHLAGNRTFQAYMDSDIKYDSTWPTGTAYPLFPYTLDYLSTQSCFEGLECPKDSFKGFWIMPINRIKGLGQECFNLANCEYCGAYPSAVSQRLMNELERIRNTTRVPLTLVIETSLFLDCPNVYQEFLTFLDELPKLNDVFLVSQKQVLDFMKQPVPLEMFRTEVPERTYNCNPVTCRLQKEDGSNRYMKSCVVCPKMYPWLENPEGEIK